jgi:hypothetical protein
MAGGLTAVAFIFSYPEKCEIFAFSGEKVPFKKSVKYNVKAGINDTGAEAVAAAGADAIERSQQKQTFTTLRVSVRRFLLSSLLKGKKAAGARFTV